MTDCVRSGSSGSCACSGYGITPRTVSFVGVESAMPAPMRSRSVPRSGIGTSAPMTIERAAPYGTRPGSPAPSAWRSNVAPSMPSVSFFSRTSASSAGFVYAASNPSESAAPVPPIAGERGP